MQREILSIIIILLFLSFSASSQDKLTYSEVINIDSASKDELYNRAKAWFVNSFVSANDVIQMDDKDGGSIIGKAVMNFTQSFLSGSLGTNGVIRYSVKIFLKDDRYKYEITDFVHDPSNKSHGDFSMGVITTSESPPGGKGSMKWRTRVWNDLKSTIEYNIPALVESLINGMNTPTEVTNDW